MSIVNRKSVIVAEVVKNSDKKIIIRAIEATDNKGTIINYGDIRLFDRGRKGEYATKYGITTAPRTIDELIEGLKLLKVELDSKTIQATQPSNQAPSTDELTDETENESDEL